MARVGRKSPSSSRPHVPAATTQPSTPICLRGRRSDCLHARGCRAELPRCPKAAMLTARHAAIRCHIVPPRRGGTFICTLVRRSMSHAQTSHLLPTYARVDLAFERGEGAWLFATNG